MISDEGRVERLERSLRSLRAAFMASVLVIVFALAWMFWYFAWRHVDGRADTMVAKRFILEHEGRTRAELSMHRGGFAQLLLGPDQSGKPGVSIFERAQIHVRSESAHFGVVGGTIFLGRTNKQGIAAALSMDPEGRLRWNYADSLGRHVHFPGSKRAPAKR